MRLKSYPQKVALSRHLERRAERASIHVQASILAEHVPPRPTQREFRLEPTISKHTEAGAADEARKKWQLGANRRLICDDCGNESRENCRYLILEASSRLSKVNRL